MRAPSFLLSLLASLAATIVHQSLASPTSPWFLSRHASVLDQDNRDPVDETPFFLRAAIAAAANDNGAAETSGRTVILLRYEISVKNPVYVGDISLGTPAQTLTMTFLSMATSVLVPDFRASPTHHYYNHTKSSTYIANGTKFDMPFFLRGYVSQDVMRIGDIELANQPFIEVTVFNNFPAYPSEKYDGFFGLGFDAKTGIKLPLHALVDSGVLDEPVFAFNLAKNSGGSEIMFGGANKDHYSGPITYASVIRINSWTIKLDDVLVTGKRMTKHRRAIIEPGTQLIYAPGDEVDALASLVGATRVGLFYEISCAAPGPEIVFAIGGTHFTLTKDEYTLQPEDGSDKCRWAINSMSFTGNTWWLGQVFIEKYYAVFNYGDGTAGSRRIGFALRK
uniref:Peptidase A1 domain-containing protein n=1 Tax=Globisporangium ultimum (strain ATCC 200006 / CBS 805.95 / DAOM BR144) TaxID=431595 RepID=K3XBE9_GLOUD